jgi:protein-disulfide isomerase
MRVRDRLLVVATLVFLGLAVGTSYRTIPVLVRNARAPRPARVLEDWERYLPIGRRLGSDSADIRILEFLDYTCSACRDAQRYLEAIIGHPRYKVSLSVRYRMLQSASVGRVAAVAGLCADQQGHFASLHRMLISTDSLAFSEREFRTRLPRYAAQAGLADTIALKNCMSSSAPDTALASDSLAGLRLGVRLVPTFIVEGILFEGLQPQLIKVVEHLLAERERKPD